MSKFVQYIKESREELVHKTTWPTMSELQNNTVVVAVASSLFALGIAGVDFVFKRSLDTIFSWFV